MPGRQRIHLYDYHGYFRERAPTDAGDESPLIFPGRSQLP